MMFEFIIGFILGGLSFSYLSSNSREIIYDGIIVKEEVRCKNCGSTDFDPIKLKEGASLICNKCSSIQS